LVVLVGRIHIEIDRGECPVVAACARDRLVGEAAHVLVEHNFGRIPVATAGLQNHSAETVLIIVSGNGSG
jgi:hypothetical protein